MSWIDVGAAEALFAQNRCRSVSVGGLEIGLFQVEGSVFALDDVCSHGRALLSDGDLQGYEIECPLHAAVFDVRSGAVLCAPAIRAQKRFDVRVSDGRVLICVDD